MPIATPVSNALSLPPTAAPENAPQSAAVAKAASFGVKSDDILRGQKAVEIIHNGSTYRLQATRLGKLILTK
jgi:hemin uptake protein HemP